MTMPAQRPGRSEQSVGTPKVFLDAVRRKFGITEFDIDLAADATNAVCELYYTKFDNALVQPWKQGDGVNWLNPPFFDIAPWVERAYRQTDLNVWTAVLVPSSTNTNWWRDWVHEKALVRFPTGRLTFVGHTASYPKDLALLLYGPDPRGRCLVGEDSLDDRGTLRWYDVWDWRKS